MRKIKVTVKYGVTFKLETVNKEEGFRHSGRMKEKRYRLRRLKMNVVGFTAPSEKVYGCRASTYIFSEGIPGFYEKQ